MTALLARQRWPVLRWNAREWLVASLSVVLIASLPLGLQAARWLRSDQIVWTATLGGAICGLLLARLVRRPSVAASLILLLGVLFVTQAESSALPPPRPAIREIEAWMRWAEREASLALIDLASADEEVPPTPHPTMPPPPLPEWRAAVERLRLLGYAWGAEWPPVLKPDQRIGSQLLLASILGLLAWIGSGLAAWTSAGRRSIWGAAAAILALLAASVYLSGAGWEFLVIGTMAGLLLAGDRSLRELENRREEGALYDWLRSEWWMWSGVVAFVASGSMGLAILATDPDFARQVRDFFEPPRPAPSAERGPRSTREQGPPPGVLPREHLLGSGPELSEQIAMAVHTPGSPPGPFYWRAGSYNIYTGHGWLRHSLSDPVGDTLPLWPESTDPPPGFALLRQSFRLGFNSQQVYAAGRPVRLNQDARGIWLEEGVNDLIAVESLTGQSAYEVLSWVPAAAPDDLRAAGGEVPEWAAEVYLQLPDELPERVRDLARDITQDAPTAYDQALALEATLREYEYTLNLPAPPEDRDLVDIFLFESKRGYCDYYASAMVVMARTVGLPARLATGYRTGRYDPEVDAYQVSMADAHSWPEIYFAEYGWIPFEPTGGVPAIAHGLPENWYTWTPPASTEPAEPEWVDPRRGLLGGRWRVAWWQLATSAAILMTAAAGLLVHSAVRERKRRRLPPDQITISLYADLRREARRLDVPLADSQTPHEMLAALSEAITAGLAAAPRGWGNWDARLETIRAEGAQVVDLYAAQQYSAHPVQPDAVQRILAAWPDLVQALRFFRLSHLLSRLRKAGR